MTTNREASLGILGMLRQIYGYIRPYRWRLIPVVLGCAVEMTFNAQIPLSMKYLIDRALGQSDRRVMILVLVALGLGAVVSSFSGLGRDYLYAKIIARSMADLRYRMFEKLQRLSLNFYARSEVGDLLSRFSNDLNSLHEVLIAAMGWGIQPALDLVMTASLVFAFEWRLALVGIIVCPICVLGPRFLSRRTMQASTIKQDQESSLMSALQENVSAPGLIRAYNLQDTFLGAFRRRNSELFQAGVRLGFLSSAMDRSAAFGTLLLQVIVIGIGGYMAFRGDISVGTFASFQALFMSMSWSFGYIAAFSPNLIRAGGGTLRIEELLSERPAVEDHTDAVVLSSLAESIVFRNVGFSYTGEQKNLKDVSLTIPKGSFVAFVGSSGSGKSTILNLLLRFYDPDDGQITFDGIDVRNATQKSLRDQIAIVFQENFLFNMTVRENIALGKPGATEEEIVAAARAAEIHDFIDSLPEGYNTRAGERGSRFPGGQRQRLAIARAVLRNPSILILDEATSALDSATEAAINDTFQRVARGRTMISVTHRLSSAVNADCIFVLERGVLIEQGTHAELLAANGAYAKMCHKQSGLVLKGNDLIAAVEPSWLLELPLLRGADAKVLEEMVHWFGTEHFRENQVILSEGDPGSRFYVVVRGTVEVSKATLEGATKVIAVLQDGDYFGEMALLNNEPRNATVRAITATVCLTLQRDHFLGLLERNPALLEQISKAAAARN